MTKSLVQLDYDKFFRAFLSPPRIKFRPKRVSVNPFARLDCANDLSESKVFDHFITAVRSHHLTPGSTLTDVPFDCQMIGNEFEVSMQAAVCRLTDVPKRSPAHWTDSKVPVWFSRYVPGADPFQEVVLDETWTETGSERKRLRDRATAGAEFLFAAQQRVFMFMVHIFGRRFRLLRWDRAGVIATPPVDYVRQPALLCDCLRRLSLLDDISLGFDPTATLLRSPDPDFLRMGAAAVDHPSDVDPTERPIEAGEIGDAPVFHYVRSIFRKSLPADWPRYRLQVQHAENAREYLIGKPWHLCSDIVNRGTRGYVALDCETQRFVWLKDVWCMSDLVPEREGDILDKLNSAGVPNVPTVVCHGDFPDQTTVIDMWWEIAHGMRPNPFAGRTTSPGGRKRKRDDGSSGEDSFPDATRRALSKRARQGGPLQRHTHYRIAVEEVALPLTKFRCGKQLASIALDCLRAHHQAATNDKTRILHRDISSGNMLIYSKVRHNEDGKGQSMCWTGLLTDWELAWPLADQETPRLFQNTCLGTHLFTSVYLLGAPLEPTKISDELESFFHVLVYFSVSHLRSNCSWPDSWIKSYFPSSEYAYLWTGGGTKTSTIKQDGHLSTMWPQGPLLLLFNSPMDQLLGELLKSFTAHYKVTNYERRQTYSPGFSSSSSSALSSAGADKTIKRPKIHVPPPCYSDDSDLEEAVAKWKPYKPPDNTPTAEDRKLARRVSDHSFALDFIADLLRRE